MKKIISILVSFILCTQVVSASVLGDIYMSKKDSYQDIVSRLYEGGATDDDMTKFFDDVQNEIIKNYTALTNENFDEVMQGAIEKALKYSSNQKVYDALASKFTNEALYYLLNGKVPESLKALYDNMKSEILASEELMDAINKTFLDEGEFAWAMPAILPLVKSGILKGYSDKTFRGNNPVTRAEFTKMVVMAFSGNDTDATSDFVDVNENDWFYSYVSTAKNAKIISGYTDNTFKPNDTISRQDMALIIKNAKFSDAEAPIPSFSDLHEISNYASEAVCVLVSKGVIRGMGDGTFKPKSPATRAQAAQMIYNAMNQGTEE